MIKEFDKFKNYQLFFVLVFFYLSSRLILNLYGIVTDPNMIVNMWQILDLNLLNNNLFSSLYYLHYQPPFWNFILGIMVKFNGPDYLKLTNTIYYFNLIISIASIWVFILISKTFNIRNINIFLLSLIFITLSLSYFFYENYTHYTHLTAFIYILFIYNFLKFSENFYLKYELNIYLVSTVLVYTWSAYSHPLFIILIFVSTIIIKNKITFLRSFLLFVIFFIIAILPSIKNKIEVNFFGNSSWVGFQIIQTLLAYDDVLDGNCRMSYQINKKFENKYLNDNPKFKNFHPSLIGDKSKWNNVGTVYLTKKCLKKSIELIRKNPLNYIDKVKFNFISTHGHYSFDHGFKPLNWEEYFGFVDLIKDTKFTNSIKVRSLQLYYLSFYIFFGIMIFKSLKNFSNTEKYKVEKALSSIFFVFFWMIVLTHLFAAYEHERMRHIGHFLHFLFFIILLKEKFNLKKLLFSKKEIQRIN